MIEQKFSLFDEASCFVCLNTKQAKIILSRFTYSVCDEKVKIFRLSVCTYVRTWILAVDTITFEGVSESKQKFWYSNPKKNHDPVADPEQGFHFDESLMERYQIL